MNGTAVYKKPIAILMMLLSIVAAAVWFLYLNGAQLIATISADFYMSIAANLPVFGDAMTFPLYLRAGFAGLIALVCIFGLTGKKGKLGFLFLLLADLVYALVGLFGATPIVEVEAIQKIVLEYGAYASYAIYGLILLGAIFFLAGLISGRDEFEFSGGAAILPIIYLALVVVGYIALILLPKFLESFTLSAEMLTYAILGAVALPLVLTLIGVHNGALSRACNGWLLFAALFVIGVLNLVPVVMANFIGGESGIALDLYEVVPYCLTPIVALFGVIGFTAADLRN